MTRRPDERTDRGAATVLIVGFAVVLLLVTALVVDATAAYLRRQDLDTLADGAALRGADLAVQGSAVYSGGLTDASRGLALDARAARVAVADYLRDVGAYREHPGLDFSVRVAGRRLIVHLTAPLHLPLHLPGGPTRATIGATGSAVVEQA